MRETDWPATPCAVFCRDITRPVSFVRNSQLPSFMYLIENCRIFGLDSDLDTDSEQEDRDSEDLSDEEAEES